MDLLRGAGHVLWDLRWPIAIYAALYAIGAAAFLLSLRFKSHDGRLIVDRRSWAFMFAHPMQYGGHRTFKQEQGSICAFYARMFNMLLFVWPFLLVYFVLASTAGSLATFLMAGNWMLPNLHEAGFVGHHRITFPLVLVIAPLGLLTLAIVKHNAVLHFLSVAAWIVLCLSPVLALLVFGLVTRHKSRTGTSPTVNAFKEVVAAKKDRFCKLIQFQ
jgi:hypothetical protein